MILILSLGNTVVFSYLFYLHLRTNWGKYSCLALFKKVKTNLLWLLILLNVLTVIRYAIFFTSFTYASLIILQQFIQSIIFFQICYFYTKKASQYVENIK